MHKAGMSLIAIALQGAWLGSAFAQATAASSARSATSAAIAPAMPAPPAPAPAGSSAALSPPPTIAVDDPMLAPVPAPKRVLASWAEAAGLLRARSTDLRIALDQVLSAEGTTRIALAQYLPSLVANGSYTHQLRTKRGGDVYIPVGGVGYVQTGVAPLPDLFAGNIQAQQALINVSAFDQISIDELNEDATKLTVEDTRRTLLLGLANQIVAVVTGERSAEINRVGLKVALEQLALVKRKQELGGATALDVVRIEQNSEDARAMLVDGDELLRVAREGLGIALGLPEETGVAPSLDVNGIAEGAMRACRTVASVDERPDVASAQTNLAVAKRNLRNVWFSFLPNLSVASTIAATSVVPPGFPDWTWNVQGLLTVPIWDGGAREGNLKVQRAGEDIAASQLEAIRRQSLIQVEQAQRELTVAVEADKVAIRQRDVAMKNEQLTQLAFAAGWGTSLELVTALEARRAAELNLAVRDFAIVKARLLALMALATCP